MRESGAEWITNVGAKKTTKEQGETSTIFA